MFEKIIANVRQQQPLIHCITNYVTVGDVANILLACGGSPIMADAIEEVEEITAICAGLDVNIGTLNARTIQSMEKAAQRAHILDHVTVLDPVGAGASRLRTDTAKKLLETSCFQVIRGNMSEIRALAGSAQTTRGVDASLADAVTEENLDGAIAFIQDFQASSQAVIVITGAIDLVAGPTGTYVIRNGHPMMSQITGTGCMLTAVIAAYCAANPDKHTEAAAAAVSAMGLCGERAHEKTLQAHAGTGSFRTYLIDAMSQMDDNTLAEGGKIAFYKKS